MYMTQKGMSGYNSVNGAAGVWSWEFYPPPYDFLAPMNSAPMPAPILSPSGFGGLGCGGDRSCGCAKTQAGLGDLGTMFQNIMAGNLSDALMGTDLLSGVPNLVVIAAGAWLISKISGDVGTATKKVKRIRSRARRRAQLQKDLEAS